MSQETGIRSLHRSVPQSGRPDAGTLSWSSPAVSPVAVQLPEAAVVIPTFNNEMSIGSLVLLARKYAAHVIVADAGSTDRTAEVAAAAGADVLALAQPCHRVQALLAGTRRAIGYDCRVIVFLDSKGDHLARHIPHLAQSVLEGADLVIGSRALSGRKSIPPFNPAAHTPAPEAAGFLNTDPQSMLRAISVRGITLLDLLPFSDSFEPMMVDLFRQKGFRLKEIPVTLRSDLPATDSDEIPRYRGKKVAVVIPAHNEELLIGETLAGIPDFVCRIYAVNDASTDKTQEIMEHYASKDPAIIPLRHEKNRGVGAAIATGYLRALEDGMDIIAVMGGDNQMDPEFLPNLLDPIVDNKCDYTMGNRLVNPIYRASMSTWRFAGNTMLTMLTKVASGYWSMIDPQNGYTAISRRALERIDLEAMYPRYGYCNDLLVRLNISSFRVINVPHPARYGREKSGIKYSTYIVNVSKLLLLDFLWRLKVKYVVISFHPLVLFYFAGALFTLAGFFGVLFALYQKVAFADPLFVPLTLSLVVIGVGFLSLFFAMFFDMMQEKGTNGWYA